MGSNSQVECVLVEDGHSLFYLSTYRDGDTRVEDDGLWRGPVPMPVTSTALDMDAPVSPSTGPYDDVREMARRLGVLIDSQDDADRAKMLADALHTIAQEMSTSERTGPTPATLIEAFLDMRAIARRLWEVAP
jgi:hypothetical protein